MRTALTLWSASVFVVLWVGFVVVLLDDGRDFESLDEWIDGQSAPLRAVVWVLFLPIVVGVKAWTSASATFQATGVVALLIWAVASIAGLTRLVTA